MLGFAWEVIIFTIVHTKIILRVSIPTWTVIALNILVSTIISFYLLYNGTISFLHIGEDGILFSGHPTITVVDSIYNIDSNRHNR